MILSLVAVFLRRTQDLLFKREQLDALIELVLADLAPDDAWIAEKSCAGQVLGRCSG